MPTFEVAGIARLDEVRGLWLDLHHHHRQVVRLSLVEDDDLSWQRRRALYANAAPTTPSRWVNATRSFTRYPSSPTCGAAASQAGFWISSTKSWRGARFTI
ncbi:MAG TPA: hypothetical protein VGI50_02980 [Solirubrobacteraceae bacterium]